MRAAFSFPGAYSTVTPVGRWPVEEVVTRAKPWTRSAVATWAASPPAPVALTTRTVIFAGLTVSGAALADGDAEGLGLPVSGWSARRAFQRVWPRR